MQYLILKASAVSLKREWREYALISRKGRRLAEGLSRSSVLFAKFAIQRVGKRRSALAQPGESIKGYDFNDLTGRIIGAALEVHKELGPGFQEVVYQRALALELDAAGLEYTRETKVSVFYKGKQIDTRRVDFVIGDCIVEIKARAVIQPEDYVQTLSYLKASRYRVALLINFGSQKAEIKRLINERGKHAATMDA